MEVISRLVIAFIEVVAPVQSAPTKPPNDEILDLLEFGIPNCWQTKAMVLQDFDLLDHVIPQCVSFCKQMEAIKPSEGELNSEFKKGNDSKKVL
jgi:hypothetical protein